MEQPSIRLNGTKRMTPAHKPEPTPTEPENWHRPPFTSDRPATSAQTPEPEPVFEPIPEQTRSLRPAMIFDLDGVISDAEHRQHYLSSARARTGRSGADSISPQDWSDFFTAAEHDPPLPDGLALVTAAVKASARRIGAAVIICTARPHYTTDITRRWLADHGVRPNLLILRTPDDESSSEAFKHRELGRLREAGYSVELAIDDDERIISMYRDEGVFALYRHSGYYDWR